MLTVTIGAKKRPAGAEELAWRTLSVEEILNVASTPTLFGGARIFVLEAPVASERSEEFLDIAEALVESPHHFVFEEEKLLKAPHTALTKAGANIVETKVVKKEFRFDQFGVATALGARDRKRLWLGLMGALRAGEKAEALGGLMVWKARQMNDVGLSRALTYLYHDAHRGAGDLELLLERFALTL